MRLLKLLGVMSLGLAVALAEPPKKDAKKVDVKVQVKKGAEPVDINTATADQLKTIAGIGEAYSAKIIQGRPYKRKDELAQKGILPQGVYDKVKEQIVAKQK